MSENYLTFQRRFLASFYRILDFSSVCLLPLIQPEVEKDGFVVKNMQQGVFFRPKLCDRVNIESKILKGLLEQLIMHISSKIFCAIGYTFVYVHQFPSQETRGGLWFEADLLLVLDIGLHK